MSAPFLVRVSLVGLPTMNSGFHVDLIGGPACGHVVVVDDPCALSDLFEFDWSPYAPSTYALYEGDDGFVYVYVGPMGPVAGEASCG